MEKYARSIIFLSVLSALLIGLPASWARAQIYTTRSGVHLRSGPGLEHHSLLTLEQNQTLRLVSKSGRWFKVRTTSGATGFVRKGMASDVWIKVHKAERKLMVMRGKEVYKVYPVALCPFNPLGDKVKQGDGGTPEGRFFLCEMIREPRQAKYGARSMRLSYPNREDARRGLTDRLITKAQYLSILKALNAGRMPPQNTTLGGSIRIHGGGSARHWTLGCIGLDDGHAKEVFDLVIRGTRVEVYRSAKQDRRLNAAGWTNARILAGAKAQLAKPALYTRRAMGVIRMKYPGGDIAADEAVCTDVVIRALRAADLDLQALLHEDRLRHGSRYPLIKRPNHQIDHRRARNLTAFFRYHAQSLSGRTADMKPGDVVLMDTGIPNGTPLDHIGIVGDTRDGEGDPMAINIWTVGMRTAAMALLGKPYPKVVAHFRLGHPFDFH